MNGDFPITYSAEPESTGQRPHDQIDALIEESKLFNILNFLTQISPEYSPLERMMNKETFLQQIGEAPSALIGFGLTMGGGGKKKAKSLIEMAKKEDLYKKYINDMTKILKSSIQKGDTKRQVSQKATAIMGQYGKRESLAGAKSKYGIVRMSSDSPQLKYGEEVLPGSKEWKEFENLIGLTDPHTGITTSKQDLYDFLNATGRSRQLPGHPDVVGFLDYDEELGAVYNDIIDEGLDKKWVQKFHGGKYRPDPETWRQVKDFPSLASDDFMLAEEIINSYLDSWSEHKGLIHMVDWVENILR